MAAFALVIQICVAVFLFVAIGAAATLLNFLIGYWEHGNMLPEVVIEGMRGLELLLWAVDVVCFVLLLAVEVRTFCRTMVGEWKGHS